MRLELAPLAARVRVSLEQGEPGFHRRHNGGPTASGPASVGDPVMVVVTFRDKKTGMWGENAGGERPMGMGQEESPMTFALLAALLIAPQGEAYTMMQNEYGQPLYWRQMPIQFSINPDNPFGLSEVEVEDAVLSATEAWEDVGAAIEFEYLGFTDTDEMGFDQQNVIFFDESWDQGDSKAAMTYNWSTEDGAIVSFDVGLNAEGFEWTIDELDPVMDIENVMAHELGHVLGLGHSDIDDLATMWEMTEPGELIKRNLRPDDENGLLANYGADVPMGMACSSSSNSSSALGWMVGVIAAGLCLRRRKDD
jgi:hypothetical protein